MNYLSLQNTNFSRPQMEIFLTPRQTGKSTEIKRHRKTSLIVVMSHDLLEKQYSPKERENVYTASTFIHKTIGKDIKSTSIFVDEFSYMKSIKDILGHARYLGVKKAILIGTTIENFGGVINILTPEVFNWTVNLHKWEQK